MSSCHRVLVINPNSTRSITDSIRVQLQGHGFTDSECAYFTGPPDAPPSIDDEETGKASSDACLTVLTRSGNDGRALVDSYDAFLVACLSVHPLVEELRKRTNKPVLGIMEASLVASLRLVGNSNDKFGIVTTGKRWETVLAAGVKEILTAGTDPGESMARFAGVTSTGLSAVQLHTESKQEVDASLESASVRLVQAMGAKAIILGCAGMVGMEDVIANAVKGVNSEVAIVDGVMEGVKLLQEQPVRVEE